MLESQKISPTETMYIIAPDNSPEFKAFNMFMTATRAMIESPIYEDIKGGLQLMRSDVQAMYGMHELSKHGIEVPDPDNMCVTEVEPANTQEGLIQNLSESLIGINHTPEESNKIEEALAVSYDKLAELKRQREWERVLDDL